MGKGSIDLSLFKTISLKGGHKMKKNGKKQVRKAEGRKVKDPKRIEAAKKAWQTIRAKTKGKQVT